MAERSTDLEYGVAEPALPICSVAARRQRGAFYTPRSLAAYVAHQALVPCAARDLREAKILDPACGDGVLLAEALRWLCARWNVENGDAAAALSVAQRHLFGVDRDRQAIDVARRTIVRTAMGARADDKDQFQRADDMLRANFVCRDALLPSEGRETEWFQAGAIDVVLANPPFLNIRRLSQSYDAAGKAELRERYSCATGNFDLYVLFIERALQLLRPAGRAAFVTPNKLSTMRYAAACRRLMLQQTTLESVLDAGSLKLFFGADVYPYVWVFRREAPKPDSELVLRRAVEERQLSNPPVIRVLRQSSLNAAGFVFDGDVNVESRVETEPLSWWGVVHSGASGFTAHRLLDHLEERDASSLSSGVGCERSEPGWEFIVSGNIDRYAIAMGDVRYMRHQFRRPILKSSCPLTPRKQQLYGGRKIVVAGMSRRLEAALDESGLALGVQVYAVTATGDETDYLLGILNSKLLSHLFRLRFAAKRLSDGYLAVNKAQLDLLPVARANDARSQGLRAEIIDRVRLRRQRRLSDCEANALDQRIDRLVYALYQLTDDEIAAAEQAIA